jgi:predicted phage tail protein
MVRAEERTPLDLGAGSHPCSSVQDHSTLDFEEELTVKKNVGRGEGGFRFIVGAVLIVISFFVSGIFRWVLGLAGVVLIFTALFGY